MTHSYINDKGQKVTDYNDIKEYEQFLKERLKARKKNLWDKINFWNKVDLSDEGLIELRIMCEENPWLHEGKLRYIYNEMTKRKL